jgi:hypothetical protein
MPGLSKNDAKGLWAVLWRVLILAPFLWLLGSFLLLGIFAAFIAPPFYLICSFIAGDWYFGLAALVPWLVLLRFRRPILRWVLDGIEWSSI